MPDHVYYPEYSTSNIQDYIREQNAKLVGVPMVDAPVVVDTFELPPEMVIEDNNTPVSVEPVVIEEHVVEEPRIVSNETIDFLKLTPEEVKEMEESLKRYQAKNATPIQD